jgi:hypothetical protein
MATTAPTCPRGHTLAGYNLLPRGMCRTCGATFQWARKHKLFYDNPKVTERATRLYAEYLERDRADEMVKTIDTRSKAS